MAQAAILGGITSAICHCDERSEEAIPTCDLVGGCFADARSDKSLSLVALIPAIPTKVARSTSEIWDMGHLAVLSGMLNEGCVQAWSSDYSSAGST